MNLFRIRALHLNGSLFFFETDIPLDHDGFKLCIPSSSKYNSALILGIETSDNLLIEIYEQRSIKYNVSQKFWELSDQIHESVVDMARPPIQGERCLNCDGQHSSDVCDWPQFMHNCHQCLVTSLDGRSHCNPCQPINRKSIFRENIFAKLQKELFTIMFRERETSVLILNKYGAFEEIGNSLHCLSVPTDGLLSFGLQNDINALKYSVNSLARCSILFAIFDGMYWRLRFRAVITLANGLIVFKVTSTLRLENGCYEIPQIYKDNTIALIGLVPKAQELTAMVQVKTETPYAGTSRWKSDGKFNIPIFKGIQCIGFLELYLAFLIYPSIITIIVLKIIVLHIFISINFGISVFIQREPTIIVKTIEDDIVKMDEKEQKKEKTKRFKKQIDEFVNSDIGRIILRTQSKKVQEYAHKNGLKTKLSGKGNDSNK